MMKNKYTFWKLINEYIIKIPIIQRDYAQGRKENKIENIRNIFLDTLYEMIHSSDKTIDLDFIYGSEINNSEGKILTPLDGQQRLTTLFLLHWYLALKDGKLNDTVKETLKRFTYETRISSRDFCEKIITEDITFKKEDKLSDIIEDYAWFFLSWKKDPTIQSMLVMMDAIHNKFHSSEDFFEKLIDNENKPITFQFLKLDNFGLTDTLYIKMNARGKALSDFENFKAKFEPYLSVDMKSKLDNSWTDLFWKHRDDKSNKIDERFLIFFQNITLNLYLSISDKKENEDINEIDIFSIYEKVYSNTLNVELVSNILDYLYNNQTSRYFYLFENFIKNKTSRWDIVSFHALTLGIVNQNDLDNWMRVSLNLINNTRIELSKDLVNSINSLYKLFINANGDIHQYLINDTFKTSMFSREQVDEEQIKVKLINDDIQDWKSAILKYENHEYFKGQVCFLLRLSRFKLDKFIEYGDKCTLLFNQNILNHSEFIFHRALLNYYDYTPSAGSRNYTFCVSDLALRSKIDNWRKVLNNKKSLVSLEKLLKEVTVSDIEKSLYTIINSSIVSDWREYFIKDKKFIGYCKRKQFRYYSKKEIYPLHKERMNGKHLELYSYIFYINNIEGKSFVPFDKPYYLESTSWGLSSIRFDWKYNEIDYFVDIEFKYESDDYSISFFCDEVMPSNIIDIVEKIGFVSITDIDDYSHFEVVNIKEKNLMNRFADLSNALEKA